MTLRDLRIAWLKFRFRLLLPQAVFKRSRPHAYGRVVAAGLLACVLVAAWAGWAIGYTQGRGWRGAFVREGCVIACPHGERAR
jgi:hypothetical protein